MGEKVKVTLLATSDIHGYYLPWDYSKDENLKTGGLSRISTVVKKIRDENPNTVLIDNGDLIQGNSAESFLKRGKHPAIEVINRMGYEIYNMGNHEFNFGMDTLISVVNSFYGISMMGNLYRKKHTMRYMNGIYYKYFDNIKIAFIALNTPLIRKFEAKRGHLIDYDVIDADFELKRILEELDPCDAVIGLFHMGDINENSIENTGVEDLILNIPGSDRINAVFGGHMHKLINRKINSTIFLEPGHHGEGLSRLELHFDRDAEIGSRLIDIKSSIIKIDDSIESDPEIEEIMKPYHEELQINANKIVGYSELDLLDKDEVKGIPQTRVAETLLSDFYLDVMLKYSQADVVAINIDNPYPHIPAGEIRRKHINNSYPYSGGEISKYKISGADLKAYMEWSASVFNKFDPADINISFDPERIKQKYSTFDIFGNVKYTIDIDQPVGSRIKNLTYMDGRSISDEDIIIIGLNKYRMDLLTSDEGPLKGKKYKLLWSSIKEMSIDGTIRNLAIKYIDECFNGRYVAERQNRWSIIHSCENELFREKAIKLVNEGYMSLYKNELGEIDLTKPLNLNCELTKIQIDDLKQWFDIGDSKLLKDVLDKVNI